MPQSITGTQAQTQVLPNSKAMNMAPKSNIMDFMLEQEIAQVDNNLQVSQMMNDGKNQSSNQSSNQIVSKKQ